MQAYMGGIAPTYSVKWKKSSSMAIFLAGCDFNCPHCTSHELIDFKEDYLTNLLSIKKEITNNSHLVDSIFFAGGEPTLQRQALLSISRHARTANLNIGLKTNGTKPDTIKSLLNENFLDFIQIRLQTDFDKLNFQKATRSQNFFNPTDNIMNSINKTLELLKKNDKKLDISFETIISPGINDDLKILRNIAKKIENIRGLWIITSHKEIKEETEEETNLISREFLTEIKFKIEEEFPYIEIEIQ